MPKDHGPTVKDDAVYEALREQGAGKEKAARIANSDRHDVARRGGSSPSYDEWTKDDLHRWARELEVEGRSPMTKGELIHALRSR
jgi:hypothetical protein